MKYMEVSRPRGNGRCSDNECPCGNPGARIRRGKGYMYVSQQVADFRTDCLTEAEAMQKIRKAYGSPFIVVGLNLGPILMCKEGAMRRGLDLAVASADAEYWWRTGLVPVRATPLAGPKLNASLVDSRSQDKKWWQFWK